MRITFGLLRVALGLFFVLLPFVAIGADLMIRVVSLGLVLALIGAFIMAFIELALLLSGHSSSSGPRSKP
jgi:hypothetical protein